MSQEEKPSLRSLTDGQTGSVSSVVGDDVVSQRLKDLGFWVGTEVARVRTAPLGDPIVFRLRGFQMALRRDEAERILLCVDDGDTN